MNVWPRLLKLVWPQRRLWFATLFLAFGSLACAVGLMGTAAWLISQAALQPSISELGLAIVGVRFFGLARGLVRYAERYLGHDLAFRLAGQLRCWLYQRLEPLAPARLSKMASGDLLSRVVADVEKVEEFFISALTPPAVALLTAGLLGGLLLALGDGLALPALVGLALGAALTWWAARLRSTPTGRAVAELRGRLAKVAMDGLQGAREIVAAGAQQRHGAKLAEIDDALGAARRRLTSRAALGQAVASMTGHWTLVAVLLVAIPAVRAGTLDRVLLPVVALLVLSAFEAVGPLVPAWRSAIEGAASGRRLFEILDAKPAVQAGGKPWRSGDTATSEVRRAPALRITDLHFAYAPGAPPVLRGVDVDLPAGQTLLITGASGGGKTTLLNLLLRFWDYSEGSIRLDGDELSTLDAESVRRRIGLISQDAHVFTGTLMGNLRLAAPEASPQDIAEAVRRARLDDLVERLPSGYSTWLGEHGVNLSGGERQRVAIARALLQDVPWVLLDEPTAHLDPTTAEQVARELDTALRGTTRVVVSHRPDVWWHRADRILQLRDGRGRDEPCRPRTTAAAD